MKRMEAAITANPEGSPVTMSDSALRVERQPVAGACEKCGREQLECCGSRVADGGLVA